MYAFIRGFRIVVYLIIGLFWTGGLFLYPTTWDSVAFIWQIMIAMLITTEWVLEKHKDIEYGKWIKKVHDYRGYHKNYTRFIRR